MALASITVPSDPARDARARALVSKVATWPLFTLKVAWGSFEAGTTFRRAYGSNGARYLVNNVACQCSDYQEAGNICKHVRAVVLWEARQQSVGAATVAKAMRTYEELFGATCDATGCQDDALPREPGDEGVYCGRHQLAAF